MKMKFNEISRPKSFIRHHLTRHQIPATRQVTVKHLRLHCHSSAFNLDQNVSNRFTPSKMMSHATWLRLGLVDAEGSPFHELQLAKDALHHQRIRLQNYSNLFKQEYRMPSPAIEDWKDVYQYPDRPLVVDVGCGSGRFLLLLARRQVLGEEFNYLGLDINTALMSRANQWAESVNLSGSVHYRVSNAGISMPSLLQHYPGPVQLVCVQYPDPHVRKERHVVHQEFVEGLTMLLKSGGHVLLQSDIEDTATHMRDKFETHGREYFSPVVKDLVLDIHRKEELSFEVTPASSKPPFFIGSPSSSGLRESASSSSNSSVAFSTSRFMVCDEGELLNGGANDETIINPQSKSHAQAASVLDSSETSPANMSPSQIDHQERTSGWLYTGGVIPRSNSARSLSVCDKKGVITDSCQDTAELSSQSSDDEESIRSLPTASIPANYEFETEATTCLKWSSMDWLSFNPLSVPTEREVFMSQVTRGKVFRILLERH
ncbi:hypothetical protein CEUSTIGMA_g1774.t1 [Chlamydomonas eustigma]|uniref:tRNA (guanine(46)-N(7))-methyltransferase n=1 Tax=Chlamydomonas eustigma TaxID=1157962 RepID=A0A250WU50_9CHLO|nr:hypothetical protein CEUSTIGMA_g1774.t1 [Chlamydomonas eustigma]|eukprot:GAX74325.1 hypothetical protein CEUSTIGMA_g1774.t1 [Chlamydomonas eustigma]